MIQRFDISSIHTAIDDKLQEYIEKKIGRLDRYVPRSSRASAHAEVVLKESKSQERNHSTCEVTLHLPHEVINVSESTLNLYAAVDIVEAKLKQQIVKYKELHGAGVHRRLANRILKKTPAQI